MKKRMIFSIIGVLLFILSLSLVSSNFACGEVEYKEDFLPSWLNINMHYSEKPSNITSCKVSPENFKYCCDPLDVKSVNWQVGKNINAQIFDMENGYFSNTTSIKISGEGYDVFPKLQVEKGIELYSPNKGAYIKSSYLELNVSSASIFDNIYYEIKSNNLSIQSILCEDCNNGFLSLEDIDSGRYEIGIIVNNSLINYVQGFNFSIIDYIYFNRSFECEGCIREKVKPNREINVSLFINLSHYSTGRVIEYIPIEWLPVSNLNIIPFSETHNIVIFEVSGKEIYINYTLFSPNDFLSKDYVFQSSFEDIMSDEQKITNSLFWLFDLFSRLKKISRTENNSSETLTFLKVNPSEPLVYYPKSNYFEKLVIFTKNYNKNVKFRFDNEFSPIEFDKKIIENSKIFSFNTNINPDKIEKISFNIKLNNTEFYDPQFYFLNYKNMTELNYSLYSSNENFSYYYLEVKKQGFYVIVQGEKDD